MPTCMANGSAPGNSQQHFKVSTPEPEGRGDTSSKIWMDTSLRFHGVYHEVKAPERIVGTFEFEGPQGYIILSTTTFESLPGNRTKLTIQSVFQSLEDRDGELRFLTEDGLNDIFTRLDDLLKKMK